MTFAFSPNFHSTLIIQQASFSLYGAYWSFWKSSAIVINIWVGIYYIYTLPREHELCISKCKQLFFLIFFLDVYLKKKSKITGYGLKLSLYSYWIWVPIAKRSIRAISTFFSLQCKKTSIFITSIQNRILITFV